MVTAILPSMTGNHQDEENLRPNASTWLTTGERARYSVAPSFDSEATVTPAPYNGRPGPARSNSHISMQKSPASPPKLAGLVGFFTGCGALVALTLFLPLPARFSRFDNVTPGQAVADSFYVVGGIAFLVSCFCFIGLRGLQGEEGKGWRLLFEKSPPSHGYQTASQLNDQDGISAETFLPYWRLLLDSTMLGYSDARIGLAYVGGFVARASSVGISLFIPLYINAYFFRNGFCQGSRMALLQSSRRNAERRTCSPPNLPAFLNLWRFFAPPFSAGYRIDIVDSTYRSSLRVSLGLLGTRLLRGW
jgi:hypothetical protein